MAHDILIVDDESDIRNMVAGILGDEGYESRQAGDSDSALAEIENRRPSLVLLDIWLQGSKLDGLEILEDIMANHPDMPVVMMSGHGTVETAVKAIKIGAYDFVEKPFAVERLILVINRAIEASRLRKEIKELRQRAGTDGDLLGNSSLVTHVRLAIERVGPTNSRVLITGPSGAGKELIARALHAQSHRKSGSFVIVNCAAMQPDRMETELFGVESPENNDGSGRVGTFEQAHNGTLFLDEVSDMPLETQGKIVRVLQDQNFLRVGGSKSVQVDVRVIAATARDLSQSIKEGTFREDLFYRLNVVPIVAPPLRDRIEDIPQLASSFMDHLSRVLGVAPRVFGDDSLAALQSYDWPGNVRELRNVIERLLITAPGDAETPITAEIITSLNGQGTQNESFLHKSAALMGLPLREARESFEKEYLLGQVGRFGGNISRTAEFIGMERSALHRKLKSLGLNKDNISLGTGDTKS